MRTDFDFAPLYRATVGFDRVFDMLDSMAAQPAHGGYPPYNIEKVGENGLRIVLAVAGFTADTLSVELSENQLTIRGKQAEDSEKIYLHRGIAARQFQRSFMLADGIEIVGARLDNGLLSIDLMRPKIEPKVRSIQIDTASKSAGKGAGTGRASGVQTIEVGPDNTK